MYSLLYLIFFTISQNLFMAEVTGEVLELAVEERIQPDGCHALVSPEKKKQTSPEKDALKSYLIIFAP